MVLKKKLSDALNSQITNELGSAYSYLAMAAYFDDQNLKGFAHWFKVQSQEEVKHAMKLYAYLVDSSIAVSFSSLSAPQSSWKSAAEATAAAFQYEQKNTAAIHALVDLARVEHDHATEALLQWFVTEQTEEESTATELALKVKSVNNDPVGLLVLDAEVGKRA